MKIAKFVFVFFVPLVLIGKVDVVKAGKFAEGDRDPPNHFVCKQVQDPNLGKKRNELSATSLLSPAREYEDAIGEQNVLVVFVAFANQTTNDTAELEEKAREALFDGEESVNKYFQNVSQGKMSLKGKVLKGWRILPKTSDGYGYGQSTSNFDNTDVFNDTIAAIDDEVYFPDFTRIIIFVKGEKTYMMGSLGKWGNIESDDGLLTLGICWLGERNVDDQDDLRHEILHTFGFRHSGAIYLKDGDACERLCANQEITKADDTTWPPLECSTEEYGDGMCVLGHGRGYPSAFIRYKSGWLNDDQILVITESTTATLIPRSSSLEGIKMIIIKAKDADGTTKTYLLEYFKRLAVFDSSNKSGPKILVRFFNEEEELNDSGTILLLKKNEEGERIYYNTLDLKEESFCDLENGIEIKWTNEQGEEMVEEGSYAELQITLSKKESPTPTPTPSPSPTLPPIPTPSLNPTLPPIPTPEPTVTSKEMVLSVTINGINATTNSIIVARKSWVEVRAEASEPGGKMLQADKIACKMIKANGKVVYKNNANGIFRFRVNKKGEYKIEVIADKNGYQTASFQTSFKAQ